MRSAAGVGAKSRNFRVSARSTEFARQVCAVAEKYRRELSIMWLGRELPAWRDSCPIRVTVGARLGAGGATSFTFVNGEPRDWKMQIQGSRERILDSVLPHEITHTIMATHFGRPLPRWADEGAATSVEHTSERTKQDKLLIRFLTTDRGIAFNRMFAMKEYPRDILPLYSQGYSLARYLIARGGKRKFVQYIGDGMKWNNWTAATEKHYGMESLSELQLSWLDWVRDGSPDSIAVVADASDNRASGAGASSRRSEDPQVAAASNLVPLPSPLPVRASNARHDPGGATDKQVRASHPSDGWYRKRRDQAMRESPEAIGG